MASSTNVHFLPSLVAAEELKDRTVVVIDVLRATTTMAYALAAGARHVVPCLEVAEALRQRDELGEDAILGGERGGVKIPGFDLGNSPAEYTRDRVHEKIVVFTTTNGTRTLQHAAQAGRVVLASFANLAAVCKELAGEGRIEVLCAGTNERITREDVLLAGALTLELCPDPAAAALNDQAALAADAWRRVADGIDRGDSSLETALRNSIGGRNLISLGLEDDIELAARTNVLNLVPELDVARWRIAADTGRGA